MFKINPDAGLRLSTFVTTFPANMPIEKWPSYTAWFFRIWPIFGDNP